MRGGEQKHKVVAEGIGEDKVVVVVDGFNLPAEQLEDDALWVLSHAHADHYSGLQHSSWLRPGRRKIFASEVTARLAHAIVGVPLDTFVFVPMNTPVDVHPRVKMTLVDANHCPGACMMLFEFGSGRRVLHTGDFRYDAVFRSDISYAPLQDLVAKGFESIYLDTTYCHPRHASIPNRKATLEGLGRDVERLAERDAEIGSYSLQLIATYTIGKERVMEEVARRSGQKVFVDERRHELLRLSGRNMDLYTRDEASSVRAVKWGTLGETWPYFRPNYAAPAELGLKLGFKRVVGYVPTGWVSASQQRTFAKQHGDVHVEIRLVPYSEHSSFKELQEFVGWVRPMHIVPTVGATDKVAVGKVLNHFVHLVNGQASKAAFVAKMQKRARGAGVPELREDVVVLLDDDGDNDDDDDVVIISETLEQTSGRAPKVQASIKRFTTLSSPPKKKPTTATTVATVAADTAGRSDEADQQTPSSKQNFVSPTKLSSMVMSGKPAVDKPVGEYRPAEDAGFIGSPTPFGFLAHAMEMMEQDPSRLVKERILVNVFRTCLSTSPADVIPAVFMLLGRVADEQDGLELNIGGHTLVRCLSDALSISVDGLKAKYREIGDMGYAVDHSLSLPPSLPPLDLTIPCSHSNFALPLTRTVAASSKSHQRVLMAPRPSSISTVFRAFLNIAKTTGKGSIQSKKQQITRILRGCGTTAETKFCVRALISNVRIGANWRSVLPAVGKATVWHRCAALNVVPSDDELAKTASLVLSNYCVQPSVSRCCQAALAGDGDETLSLELGIPFKPMLAKPAGKGVADALALISKDFDAADGVLCEYKYDGMRAIVHVDRPGAKVTIFSRNAEDRSSTFGEEVAGSLLESLAGDVSRIILDAEICAITPDGRIDSFQKLSARATNGCGLRLVLFDVVRVDDTCLIDLPLVSRRERLRQIVTPSNTIAFAEGCLVSIDELGAVRLRELLMEALAGKAEGLMIKSLSSRYECMHRSTSWLKLKKDYIEDDSELGDTYDCRVIGAWWGNGRKAGWYSPFLVAIYDEDAESWQSLCRVLSGFSNEFYTEATARLSERVVEAKPFDYDTAETPPVWFETNEVWEIRGADLQLSPVHRAAAGSVDESRGVGLRFPRFVRTRPDKGLEDVTTASDIAALYRTN